MAITKEQAIEILEFFDFFQGQRAGRELWAEKPYEVQEEDLAYFSERVSLLKEYIADVVPKSEYDALVGKLECFLCHATGGRLSKHTYDLGTMESVATDCINETYNDGYGEGYKECASEIFEEMEKMILDNTYPDFDKDHKPVNVWKAKEGYDAFYDLKKKYTEENK